MKVKKEDMQDEAVEITEELETPTEEETVDIEVIEESTPKRRISRPRIVNKEQKIQSVVGWLESGLDEEEIRTELSVWETDRAVTELYRLGFEEFSRPKPVDERVNTLEESVTSMNERIEMIEEWSTEVNQLLDKIQTYLSKGGNKNVNTSR